MVVRASCGLFILDVLNPVLVTFLSAQTEYINRRLIVQNAHYEGHFIIGIYIVERLVLVHVHFIYFHSVYTYFSDARL